MRRYEIDFVIDGQKVGGSSIDIEDGRMSTESAEDEFYAVLRKSQKFLIKQADEEEKSDLIDSLTPQQEERLKEVHMQTYTGTDDDAPDAYEAWLEELDCETLKKYL